MPLEYVIQALLNRWCTTLPRLHDPETSYSILYVDPQIVEVNQVRRTVVVALKDGTFRRAYVPDSPEAPMCALKAPARRVQLMKRWMFRRRKKAGAHFRAHSFGESAPKVPFCVLGFLCMFLILLHLPFCRGRGRGFEPRRPRHHSKVLRMMGDPKKTEV
jgi:hypothetical protein